MMGFTLPHADVPVVIVEGEKCAEAGHQLAKHVVRVPRQRVARVDDKGVGRGDDALHEDGHAQGGVRQAGVRGLHLAVDPRNAGGPLYGKLVSSANGFFCFRREMIEWRHIVF